MSEDVGAQLRKGVVEPCILGLLAREPMYGWQLSEQLVGHGMIASIGTLYPILGRLRAQGLVSSFDEASPAGPVRKFYELTDAGRGRLAAFRQQWAPFSATVLQLVGPLDPRKDDSHD
ncbi:PadR family transcriptional regulator [Microterricola viridarii]|uniref:PadR family transcriptional regulator, regulatory protein PadR n=1 Tax=Microterricola viridarii TaxID=412690 RepID=A0A1H1NDN2_9MICO|nr:PadR family transcriptional regulator [Microterricola viridarii]SDR97073.1 PadR family transcriptional regulator, regulatory protein PadR [Microterricola viridarii]